MTNRSTHWDFESASYTAGANITYASKGANGGVDLYNQSPTAIAPSTSSPYAGSRCIVTTGAADGKALDVNPIGWFNGVNSHFDFYMRCGAGGAGIFASNHNGVGGYLSYGTDNCFVASDGSIQYGQYLALPSNYWGIVGATAAGTVPVDNSWFRLQVTWWGDSGTAPSGKALQWEIRVFRGLNIDGSVPDTTLLVAATVPNGFLDLYLQNSNAKVAGFDDMIWDDTNIPTRTPTFTAGSDFVGVVPI